MTAAAPTSAALAAFLRGIERRAALLAELQCGDPAAGDAAVGATLRAFRRVAAREPMARWPRRFWGLLLATPQLRRAAPAQAWSRSWRPLAGIGNGPRAALLLRLVAGLDPDEAAAVLGVDPVACRAAVHRALRATADGRDEADTWSDWESAFQHGLKGLSLARLQALARLRERALDDGVERGPARTRAGTAADEPAPAASTRWRRVRWIGVGACLLALAATFLPLDTLLHRGAGEPRVRIEALPPAEAPAARFDATLRAWSHRDFALLADPQGLSEAQRLPLLAWFAAQRTTGAGVPAAATLAASTGPSTGVAPDASASAVPPPARVSLPEPEVAGANAGPLPEDVEAAIAHLPRTLQPGVRVQADRWRTWTPAQQAAFRQRAAQWEAQLPAARGEQRERYAAWRALDAGPRHAVAEAAAAYALLAPEAREGLRAQFMAQDESLQRGWLLGPELGASYARLQPLVAQVPEAQRAGLLQVLRALPSGELADLALLAQRTPPQARAEVLRALVSTAKENRAAWLQAQVAR